MKTNKKTIMEIVGKLHKIEDAVQVSEKLRKAKIIIETQERYPQFISLDVLNNKIEALAPFFEGDTVTVGFFINGRNYKNANGEEKNMTSLELNTIK